jgi:EAL domain-containing protein (putative c-di-GMP-specific phosphodiesterase class I)
MTGTSLDIEPRSDAGPTLEQRLRQALEAQQFVLHYQPKMDARSRSITGVEALMRWNDPANGLIDPAQFMPVLEQTGLMSEVGVWAMKQALSDVRTWRELGHKIRVAVNVAGVQLRDARFFELVREALAQSGGADGMDLELTESGLVEDVESSIRTVRALREIGVNVAVDHFGSSRSSLPYLSRLPLQSVKIDSVFVDGAVRDAGTKTVLGTIISLAHALGFTVIAKGVESEEQWKLLRSLHCDEVQGYLFSPARPAANITRMLQVQGAPRRFLR